MALQKLVITAGGFTFFPDWVVSALATGGRYLNFHVSSGSDLKGGTLQLVMQVEKNGVNGATQDEYETLGGLDDLQPGYSYNHDFIGAGGYGFDLSGSLSGTPAVKIYYSVGG